MRASATIEGSSSTDVERGRARHGGVRAECGEKAGDEADKDAGDDPTEGGLGDDSLVEAAGALGDGLV